MGMRRRIANVAGAVTVVLALAACGGGDGASPTEVPTSTPVIEQTLGAVQWTSGVDEESGAPVDRVEFYTNTAPSIIATVQVTNVVAGDTFTATFTLDGEPILDADLVVSAEHDLPEAWVSFRLDRNDGAFYPVGDLGIVVTGSRGGEQRSTVTIQFP